MTKFYENFLRLCEKNGIKKTNVLKDLKMSTGNLNKFKNGSNIKLETAIKIAEYFECDINELIK